MVHAHSLRCWGEHGDGSLIPEVHSPVRNTGKWHKENPGWGWAREQGKHLAVRVKHWERHRSRGLTARRLAQGCRGRRKRGHSALQRLHLQPPTSHPLSVPTRCVFYRCVQEGVNITCVVRTGGRRCPATARDGPTHRWQSYGSLPLSLALMATVLSDSVPSPRGPPVPPSIGFQSGHVLWGRHEGSRSSSRLAHRSPCVPARP